MNDSTRRALLGLGTIVLVAGIAGLVVSWGQAFTEPDGARIGSLLHLNPLGSLVSIGLGTLAIVAGLRRNHPASLVAAAGLLIAAALVVVGANRSVNPLGGTASTLALFLGAGVGVLTLTLAARAARRADTTQDRRVTTSGAEESG
jgi:hypothetical protein